MSANDELAGRMARMDAARLRGVLPPDDLIVPMPPVRPPRATVRFLDAPADGFVVEVEDAPPRPGGIPWVPIADMPEAWKDGREVLLWCRNSEAMHVAWWEVRHMWAGWCRWGDDRPFFVPTHVAALNPPEGI